MKLIGLDVGYGFVKATDGLDGYSFPSVVGDGNKSGVSFRINSAKTKKRLVDNLQIAYNDKLYYIGTPAIRHSNYLSRDLSLSRDFGTEYEVLFYGALSLFCDQKENTFKVVTGLPPERMHLAGELAQKMLGERTISIVDNGRKEQIKITVLDIDVAPQPLGTYWAEFFEQDSEKSRLGKVGILDIGFGTSDFIAIEDEEYLPMKSRTLNIGTSSAYKEISNTLFENYGVMKEIHSLDEIVISKTLRISGESQDVTPILEEAFERLASKLFIELNSAWRLKDFDSLLFTGGGSHAIRKHMRPRLPHSTQIVEPFTANSRGYLMWASHKWA